MKVKGKMNFILSIGCVFIAITSIVVSIVISKKYAEVTYIKNEDDLDKIRNNLSGRFIVNADTGINITKPWVPIGSEENPFTGYIDFNYRIINIQNGFQTDYITNSINNAKTINLGLFAVNKGTILHSFVNDLRFCDDYDWSSAKENDIKINYGVLSAINYGYLTSNKTNVKQISLANCFCYANIGGVCAVNFGQIQGSTITSHFSVKSNCLTNVGCICGILEKDGILKYCYKEGNIYYTLSYPLSNGGYCVGLCRGGFISNIGLSYSSDVKNLNQSRFQSIYNPSSLNAGGLIGRIELSCPLDITNVVIDLKLESTYINKLFFGFVAGDVIQNNKKISIRNICISGSFSNLASVQENYAGLVFGRFESKEYLFLENIKFYNFATNFVDFNFFGYNSSQYNDLTLSNLGLDSAIWIKGTYHFYLNYAKVENF